MLIIDSLLYGLRNPLINSNKRYNDSSSGFTLLELLVVLAIVAVVTATAIPAYQDYKRRGFDFRALSDLKSLAIAQEAYYLDQEEYLTCNGNGCLRLPGLRKISDGVEIRASGNTESFQASSSHRMGSNKVYRWDSNDGGLLTD